MPELPPERVALLEATLPPSPILPIDLFSRGTDMQWDRFKNVRPDDYIHHYPEILDLKVSAASGTYDVVGVTNWRGQTLDRRLSFSDDLGLERGARVVAFDFWGQRSLGVFTGDLPHPGFAWGEGGAVVMATWHLLLERGARRVYPAHGPIRPIDADLMG